MNNADPNSDLSLRHFRNPKEPTLAQYIAAYIEEEQKKLPHPEYIDSYLIQNAIDAYKGGAR